MKYYFLAAVAAIGAAAPAQAEQGDWLLRGRAILVAPTEDSSGIEPAFPNDEVSVSNSFAPEVDVSYFLTDNLALELIAATTKHDVSGKTGIPDAVGELADTWALPPTLTLQYHFAPNAKVRPYVGAGINYTLFYNEDSSDGLEDALGATKVELDDSFGFALQAGVDFDVSQKVFLNLDVKYIDMDTEAKLTTGDLVNRVKVDINPIVVGVGVGMRL
jgi:outer membrane protein